MSWTSDWVKIPALLTSTSTRPKCAITERAISLTACSSATSVCTYIACRSWPRTAASTGSAAAGSARSTNATCAPSCANATLMAAPIPEAAPVTTATRPARRPGISPPR